MLYPYEISLPLTQLIPIIISAPHVGTELPLEIKDVLNPELSASLPDTDWFVDQLYDFAGEIGAVLIKARYSRYVIDLNRPIDGPFLYKDSRRQTELIPTTSFQGVPLYPGNYSFNDHERERRIDHFYRPYYKALHTLIEATRMKFGHVLLWDAHSIKRHVEAIQPEPFPDLMLGDRDGQTAAPALVEAALAGLRNSAYSVAYNQPFKGGQITRFHGQIAQNLHAMQLEMAQDIYLTDGMLDPQKAAVLKPVLRSTLLALAKGMESL